MFSTKKTGRVEGLQAIALAADLHVLADVDEGGDVGVLGPKGSTDERPHMRHRNTLRRLIAGMPMILMARVQNEAEVADAVRAKEDSSIENPGRLLEALGHLHAVEHGGNRREGGEHTIALEARFIGRIEFWIEGLGLCHSARHP